MRLCGTKYQTLNEEHHIRSAISCSLQSTEQHLQNHAVSGQKATCIARSSINNLLICWAVAYWVIEWVIVTFEYGMSITRGTMRTTYLSDVENSPFCCLIVSNQEESISDINETSIAGFSAISHVQTSIPAAIAAGVETAKGRATR